jgi:Aspartyl/Asparaginyl beta-hydroxylase
MTEIFLTQSPYWQFDPNPITDPLIENWKTIRDQFCEYNKKFPHFSSTKPNGTTWASDSVLYTGEIHTDCIMIRREQLSDYEKSAMNWQSDEQIRWWSYKQTTQPFLWNWTVINQDWLGAVTFMTNFPGAKLTHHWGCDEVDYTRIHLCLTEDPLCVFNIEGWEHSWQAGECFGFDDGWVLHGTKHDGSVPRTILSVDVLTERIKPWVKNFFQRRPRPEKHLWALLHEACSDIKSGM